MYIRLASLNDIPVIHRLAHKIWWATYVDILKPDQIEFMLNDMYSHESLKEQMSESITFLLVETENVPVAFASYALSDPMGSIFKIYKLYILPEEHGKGIGMQLINYIKKDVAVKGGEILELNINRNNPAVEFYKKCGFNIFSEVDIPYHQYILNDYVMRLPF